MKDFESEPEIRFLSQTKDMATIPVVAVALVLLQDEERSRSPYRCLAESLEAYEKLLTRGKT